MFLQFHRQAEEMLREALQGLGHPQVSPSLEMSPHADLASRAAFRLDPKNPAQGAQTLARGIKPGGWMGSAEPRGPYVNLSLAPGFYPEALRAILREGPRFGSLPPAPLVILEHTSANPDGPLHIGHLRNAVLGDTLARVLRRAGHPVEVHYYVNDMGRQMGALVWGLRQGLKPDPQKKPDDAIAEVYIQANRLLEADPGRQAEVRGLLLRYERQDPQLVREFREAVETCLRGIHQTLKRLGAAHDRVVWESHFVLPPELGGQGGKTAEIVSRLSSMPIARQGSDGSLSLDLTGDGIKKEMVLIRSDGTTLYGARDLAYHEWKAQTTPHQVNVLGADHKLHAAQMAAVLRRLHLPVPETLIFEFVNLPEGSMSTRAGTYISADDLLDKVEMEALRQVQQRRTEMDPGFHRRVARAVATGAVRYEMARVSPEKGITFDWKQALDFEKQSAPFLIYSHARACSILHKSGGAPAEFDPAKLTGERERRLIKKLSMLDYWIDASARQYRPHLLAHYAKELAEEFNQFYRDVPVLQAPPGTREARLALVEASRIVLANTLETLGIEPLAEM
ncbi:MAG: arginine--tRNA ligase [Euryarchaeota archaeon]|nr:arginine--tRNA ligase [Euryarchaeota archaeon]